MHNPIFEARSRLALATRYGDSSAAQDARRDLAAAKLEATISRTLAGSGPLTRSQVAHLVRVLREEAKR